MPFRTMDVREQRVQFVVATVRKEKPFGALCKEFAISRPTGRLWVRRYVEQGIEGIAERSRRPHHRPRRTGHEVEQCVAAARKSFPDRGARKLQHQLRESGLELTVSTIYRILLRLGLVAEQDRHRPALQRFERTARGKPFVVRYHH
ncbi:MAG: helix-turn-helix domain-containing protein [Terriglobales bacterium]